MESPSRSRLRTALTFTLLSILANAPTLIGAPTGDAEIVREWNWVITDVMMDDSRTPCTIGRIYAYCNIAAYETVVPGYPACRPLAGQLKDLPALLYTGSPDTIDWGETINAAYRTMSREFLYRLDKVDSAYRAIRARIEQSDADRDRLARSTAWGDSVARHIIAWSRTDGYRKVQTSQKWQIPIGAGLWEPTPPDFADPVDPFWSYIRPFGMDSANQFPPDPPVPFSTETGSPFYRQAMEVYEISKNQNDSLRMVPRFWDCNPIHSAHMGHLMFYTRQISPAGHWLAITRIVTTRKKLPMMETVEAYALVAMAMHDAFVSCWTEKYRSDVIRPVTYIQRYIDSTWEPALQTPPFPEHSSGHSTISAAAATVLTTLFGEMPFDDDTEVYLGVPIRHFPTFLDAAYEAAMSRLWGGIHYRGSNTAGTKNGVEIGKHLVRKIHTRA